MGVHNQVSASQVSISDYCNLQWTHSQGDDVCVMLTEAEVLKHRALAAFNSSLWLPFKQRGLSPQLLILLRPEGLRFQYFSTGTAARDCIWITE